MLDLRTNATQAILDRLRRAYYLGHRIVKIVVDGARRMKVSCETVVPPEVIA